MSQLTRTVSPETLRSWGVSPAARIEYYDGRVLVIDEGAEDVGIGTMAKFGGSLIFGVAVFTHAPLVGATLFAYAGYKVLSTVGSMYGGNHDLASKIERDLGLDTPDQPAAPDDFENRFEDAVTTYRPGTQTKLGAVEVPASPATISPTQPKQFGQWDEDEQLMTSTDRHEWMKDLLSYPSVLIYGAPGAGKSTFAEWLVTELAQFLEIELLYLPPYSPSLNLDESLQFLLPRLIHIFLGCFKAAEALRVTLKQLLRQAIAVSILELIFVFEVCG